MMEEHRTLSSMTLEELWQLFPIVLRPYSDQYPQWFEEERRLLVAALGGEVLQIRHIGSTAVPGLLSKPTIDILLEVADESEPEQLRGKLLRCGYWVMSEQPGGGEAFRMDLCKGYLETGFAEKVFHLHVRHRGDWDEPYFCTYLKFHQEVALEYAHLKQRLFIAYEHDRDAYTAGKGDFVRRVTLLARKELDSASVE